MVLRVVAPLLLYALHVRVGRDDLAWAEWRTGVPAGLRTDVHGETPVPVVR